MRFPVMIPFRYEQRGVEIDWPEETHDKLRELQRQIGALQKKRLVVLRDEAKRLGLTAFKLEDLRSESGRHFEAYDPNGRYSHEPKLAREITPEGERSLEEEWAYWCGSSSPFGEDAHASCGWVRGYPRTNSYDDIGFLSGSAGVEYHCVICGGHVGSRQDMVS